MSAYVPSIMAHVEDTVFKWDDPDAPYTLMREEMPKRDVFLEDVAERAEEDRIGAMEDAAEMRRSG